LRVRLVARGHLVFFVVGDVGVELAEVLVAEGIGLEFHEDVALEHAVVEDEIDEEVFVADEDAFCRASKQKPWPSSRRKSWRRSSKASSRSDSAMTSRERRPRNSKT